jgi:hypothetical protein
VIPSNDIAATALTIERVAKEYGDCALKHASVVNSYDAARRAAQEWNDGKKEAP